MTVTVGRKKQIIILGCLAVCVTVFLAVLLGALAGGFGQRAPQLVFASEQEEFVYDGQPHRGSKWKLVEGGLARGYTVSAEFTAERTEAGSCENAFTVSVLDENGNAVTDTYEIGYQFGTLEILPREIVLSTPSAEKEYDGSPLTAGGTELVSGSTAAGHTLHAEATGSRTEVGSSPNTAAVRVTDAGGRDVTLNYAVTVREGTLTVSPVAVSVLTFSEMKVYDGTPLACEEYTVSGLLEGDTFHAELPARQTNVGQCENFISGCFVLDANGNDVTDRYEFEFHYGELTVTPRVVAVRSADASKVYDGTPLTCEEWEIVSVTQPADGHEVLAEISGTITEVGEVPNTVAQVQVLDENGGDVTFNYEIRTEEGRLVVKGENTGEQPGGIGGSGSDLVSDGSIGSGMLEGGGEENAVALRVLSDRSGHIYFRLKSFGNYHSRGWAEADSFPGRIDGSYSMNYLPGIALREAGVSRSHIRIEVAAGDYLLPYYLGTGGPDCEIQESDVFYEGDTKSVYAAYFYLYDYVSAGLPAVGLGGYAAAEEAYAAYVREHYLSVPDSTRRYLEEVIAEQGFEKNDPDILSAVAEYIRGAAEYNAQYDRSLDEQADIAVAFLRDYKEGICQHYATAATLLLRTLGIPARYTIGYAGDAAAGKWTEITAKNAHAWTEAYIDGLGWVYVEVTGGGSASGSGETGGSGGEGGAAMELKVKPVDEFMKYDGVSTLVHSGTLQGLSALTARGYTYEAKVSGSRRDVGVSICEIASLRLYDPSGTDVTDRFRIVCSPGKLQVYLQEITVFTSGGGKVYDGEPLTSEGCASEGNLLNGHVLARLTATGSIKTVGRSINGFSISVTDAGGKDVTYMYKINAEYGILEIFPREITLTAESAEKTYDGLPLVCERYMLSSENMSPLADGQKIEVGISGSQTEIGRSENTIAYYQITDENGRDVTSNYSVRLVSGTLRVTP